MPRVSVIMGIYNCASTLEEALDSLFAQTFLDFEIVLCEDGSKDDTYVVAQKLASEHSNVKLLHNERNMGLNVTLNNCLNVAEGEYIARMDGDDISLPTRFEKEVAFLDAHPEYAIVSAPMIHFDEAGDFRWGRGGYEPSLKEFARQVPFCHAPCMVRKTAYDAVHGYSVGEYLLRQEDYHLWIQMYQHGFRGYMLAEHLYKMRDDRNAIARRNWVSRRNEAYAKWTACRVFHLPFYCYLFCLKPLILYFTPRSIYKWLHKVS